MVKMAGLQTSRGAAGSLCLICGSGKISEGGIGLVWPLADIGGPLANSLREPKKNQDKSGLEVAGLIGKFWKTVSLWPLAFGRFSPGVLRKLRGLCPVVGCPEGTEAGPAQVQLC